MDGIVSERQIVAVRVGRSGVQLYQFLPEDQIKLSWSRELRDVSRCEISVAPAQFATALPDLQPWLHWVSVWDADGQTMYWDGPVTKVVADRSAVSISANDHSALLARTRTPLGKRWDAADPAYIAAELWEAMIELHALRAQPIVRADPLGDNFEFSCVAESAMLDTVIEELVGKGLHWTVVAGVPVLGPAPHKPITALGEHDFMGGQGVQITRDGGAVFNDVLLRGADAIARARVDLAGLNLQTNVAVDSMFGVTNADKAVSQYVRATSKMRDAVTLPEGSVLHPDAPVTIDHLVPSVRFVIEAYGLMTVMELESVGVDCTGGATTVTVKMESVNDEPPELAVLAASQSGGQG